MTKIVYVVNDAWFFVSHRLPLAEQAVSVGMQAVVVAQPDDTVSAINHCGAEFIAWELSPRGKSIFGEFKAIFQLFRILREQNPDIVHLITIKPVLYGGLICRLLKVPAVVYAISGLGVVFAGKTMFSRMARLILTPIYRVSIAHPNATLIFQNIDNRDLLLSQLNRPNLNTQIIRGSGVRLADYPFVDEPAGTPTFVLAARLLKDKGITEFVEAAKILEKRGVSAKYIVAGDMAGKGNPSAYSKSELEHLSKNSRVEFKGYVPDIASVFSAAHVVVLPSYHEGLPKVLVEAGASGRPVITTDVPGCRDAIDPFVSGMLVPDRNAVALADAMQTLAEDSKLRRSMGVAGRELVKAEMQIEAVCESHSRVYENLLKKL